LLFAFGIGPSVAWGLSCFSKTKNTV